MTANPLLFEQPVPPTTQLWRYMDFAKYVSLLESRSTYLAVATSLGDPFEGSWPRATVAIRDQTRANWTPEERLTLSALFREYCQSTFVSCWHMNTGESAAMWKLYAQTKDAVAVQTTYDALYAAVDSECHIGIVKYVDYNVETLEDHSTLAPYMYKRRSFEHERELRVLVQHEPSPVGRPGSISFALGIEPINGPGISKSVDLGGLVKSVRVAPDASPWFLELVKSVSHRYELPIEPARSSLEGDPVY